MNPPAASPDAGSSDRESVHGKLVHLSTSECVRLMDAFRDGVLRIRDGRVIAGNRAAGRLLSRALEEVVGLEPADLMADAEGRPLLELVQGPAMLRDPEGGPLRPVSLVEAGPELWLLVDRARERRLEEEVWRLGSGRGRTRAAPLPPSEDPLRGEIAGMIEHEVRTAATVVRGYLRMILSERHGSLNPDQWSFAREARRAVERVIGLSDNLLDFAQSGSETQPPRKPLRLSDVLYAAVDTARPALEDAGVKIELRFDARDEQLRGDPQGLEQVFVNLIHNAARHTPSGGQISIETSDAQLDHGDVIVIAVADQGPGISGDDAERIFRPFVQGHGSPGVASGGVGLGLAICRRVIGAHGGHVDAVPDLGYGLFRVSLPTTLSGAGEDQRG